MEIYEFKEDLRNEIISTLKYCINCRFCLPSCPRFDITAGDVSQGASGITRALYYAIKWGISNKTSLLELRELIYSCMTCKSCEIACKNLSTGTELLGAIEKGRQLLLEDMMIGPMPSQKNALESLLAHGNPYGVRRSKRADWLRTLRVPEFTSSQDFDLLLFFGCTAPFHDPTSNIAKAIVYVLKAAGVSFGLIESEICCGNPALKMGEAGLFEELCEENIIEFKRRDVSHIVTLSPHCFDTFANRYPKEEMKGIKVRHYTDVLLELLNNKQLNLKCGTARRVVYQDPCYLGRHNGIYEAPRSVLKVLPGVELIEFPKSKSDSLCCGGGGGRMWADFPKEIERTSRMRAEQALELNADTIVTACPWCHLNLIDAVKTINAEDKMKVVDLSELIFGATV